MVGKMFGHKQKEVFLKVRKGCSAAYMTRLDSLESNGTYGQASALTKMIVSQIANDCQQNASSQMLTILCAHLNRQKAAQCIDEMREEKANRNFNN